MTKWEYRSDRGRKFSLNELNEIGQDGWELVAVFDQTRSAAGNDFFTYYFKRPIPDTKQQP